MASISILILAVLLRPGLAEDRAAFAWWVGGDLGTIASRIVALLQLSAAGPDGSATGGLHRGQIFIPVCLFLTLGLALQTKALARLCHVHLGAGGTIALVVWFPVAATAAVAMLPAFHPPLVALASDGLLVLQTFMIRHECSKSRALTIMAAANVIIVVMGIVFTATFMTAAAAGAPAADMPPLQALIPDFIESITATFTILMALGERERSFVRRLSTTDQLTGALNRRGFIPLLDHAWRSTDRLRGPMSLAILDIDHFKRLNDNFGHDAGDAVLAAFAAALTTLSRETDVVARWGGEEFLLLMPNTPAHSAVAALERIRAALPAKLEGRAPCPVTFSAGVYECRDTSQVVSIDALVARADDCLYKAKVWRDCIVSEPPQPEPHDTSPLLADVEL